MINLIRLSAVMLAVLPGVTVANADIGSAYVVGYHEPQPFAAPAIAILTQAYQSIGIHAEFREMPFAREIKAVDNGEADADAARSEVAIARSPGLLQVPVPWISIRYFAFQINDGIPVRGWGDLKGRHPCVLVGDLYAESQTRFLAKESARDPASLIKMLRSGRCNVAVGSQSIWYDIDAQGLGPVRATSIGTLPFYHAISRRRSELLPKLTAVFKQIRDRGAFDRLDEDIRAKLEPIIAHNSG